MKRIKYILILAVLLCSLGCSTPPPYKAYQGEENLSDLALIQCDLEHPRKLFGLIIERFMIMKIDGKSTFSLARSLTADQEYAQQALVKSGRHYLDVKYALRRGYASGDLWFDAEAGKTYVVRKAVRRRGIIFWIEEKESGKVVGGIPGGEPKPEK